MDLWTSEVCNGHGPLGKLVAFRSAQSIPKLLLEADASEASSEQLLARSVKFAAAELQKFGERNGYDLRHSGGEDPSESESVCGISAGSRLESCDRLRIDYIT